MFFTSTAGTKKLSPISIALKGYLFGVTFGGGTGMFFTTL
jgi:hypothetical protein